MHTRHFNGTQWSLEGSWPVADALAVEAPLQVKVNGVPLTTTMRTPGADRELVRGLLFTEGILPERTLDLTYETIDDPETGFTGCIDVGAPPRFLAKSVAGRRFLAATSSCGVCGVREPREVDVYGEPVTVRTAVPFSLAQLPRMLAAMKARQRAFRHNGGTHAAMAFTPDAMSLAIHEDIGRHNAVDKVIGELLNRGDLGACHCLLVSGRISYEIVSKAYRAEIPIVAGVSAPSSMAVDMARVCGMTVIGYCREGRATVYSTPSNVSLEVPHGQSLTEMDPVELGQSEALWNRRTAAE